MPASGGAVLHANFTCLLVSDQPVGAAVAQRSARAGSDCVAQSPRCDPVSSLHSWRSIPRPVSWDQEDIIYKLDIGNWNLQGTIYMIGTALSHPHYLEACDALYKLFSQVWSTSPWLAGIMHFRNAICIEGVSLITLCHIRDNDVTSSLRSLESFVRRSV